MTNGLIRSALCALVALGFMSALPASAATHDNGLSLTLPRRPTLGAGAVMTPGGVRLSIIVPGSAAERAGLRVDDLVVAVGGAAVATPAEFIARVKEQPTNKKVTTAIRRDGDLRMVTVVMPPAPVESDPAVETLYQAVLVDGTLRRTLVTRPKAIAGRRPALLIIGGIGCYSVDNPADREDAYLRLAHDLGRRGFVVMRLEKSGIGDSRGPACATVDLLSEIRSYEAAANALRTEPFVDPAHLYLFGHSIGTLIAPRLALKQPVAGLIIAEGVGRNWVEYELLNLRRQLALGGDGPAQVDDSMRLKEYCMHRLLIERAAEAEIERAEPACKQKNTYPAPAAYLQQAAAFNIAEPWTKLALPLLAIYGTGDFVTAQEDHQRIVDIVNAAHPGLASLVVIPGMDHHLDRAGPPQQAYDLRVVQGRSLPYEERMSSVVAQWLCARATCLAG